MTSKKRKQKVSAKKKKEDKLSLALIKQMLQLSTAGFGLVAALAWNDLIKTFINDYIKPYTASGSGFVSQIIYVVIVTVLAVTVTYYLTKVKDRIQGEAVKDKAISSDED